MESFDYIIYIYLYKGHNYKKNYFVEIIFPTECLNNEL